MPYTGAVENYAPWAPVKAQNSEGFTASFAFFLCFMGCLCVIYAICALRTNLILFLILGLLPSTFACLAAAFWYLAQGNVTKAVPLQTAGGAQAFVVCLLGWYIFAAILLAAVDFPLSLPGMSCDLKRRSYD